MLVKEKAPQIWLPAEHCIAAPGHITGLHVPPYRLDFAAAILKTELQKGLVYVNPPKLAIAGAGLLDFVNGGNSGYRFVAVCMRPK